MMLKENQTSIIFSTRILLLSICIAATLLHMCITFPAHVCFQQQIQPTVLLHTVLKSFKIDAQAATD